MYGEKDTGRTMLYAAIEYCVNNAKKHNRNRIQVQDYFVDNEGLLIFPNRSKCFIILFVLYSTLNCFSTYVIINWVVK